MKVLNIKVPIRIACLMDDNAQLNSAWVTDFLDRYARGRQPHITKYSGLCYTYSIKVPNDLHTHIKTKASELDTTMTNYTALLFDAFY